jgi:nitrogen fixation protein FixH
MKAKFFMLLPVLLLGLSFAGWAVMISMATSDPSFAVEADYYQKAARFDEELGRREASRALGWKVEVLDFRPRQSGASALRVRLVDRQGSPLAGASVAVQGISNRRAAEVHAASALTDELGQATLDLSPGPTGLWELRFTATRATVQFSEVVRTDLRADGGAS